MKITSPKNLGSPEVSILTLDCEVIERDAFVVYEGISFSNSIFIKGFVDGADFKSFAWFDSSVIVLDQLTKSTLGSGRYLLFTCICGIADDAGWEPISVTHEACLITWDFNHGTKQKIVFDHQQYVLEINRLSEYLLNFTEYTLEPKNVTPPE